MTLNKLTFPVFLMLLCLSSCQKSTTPKFDIWVPYDETGLIENNANHDNERLRYKLIQSKISDRNKLIETITVQLQDFSVERYEALRPFILDQSITKLQENIFDGIFTYKELSQWYLYRIAEFESDKDLAMNAMISINPNLISQAEKCDVNAKEKNHPIYGIPVILKDNINTKNMLTTAGAAALINNQPKSDAEIVTNLKSHGALILGKANLSEWANFLCDGCPNGYSAIGGQTLNPYGPRNFDTGGSSSGSAVSVAMNYAPAAVGTETSGSILSPSSQQSTVGLKPTIGRLSQEGIIPISSTLDTAGPITKNLDDNAILFSAMLKPADDTSMSNKAWQIDLKKDLKGVRFGAIKSFVEDSLYRNALSDLKKLGAEIIEIEPEPMNFESFLDLLNADMKIDLKQYLNTYASPEVEVKSVYDVIQFNLKDSTTRIPYCQARFDGVFNSEISKDSLIKIRAQLLKSGINYFEKPMQTHNLNAILSINNYNAGQAAAAKFPALTVPMGYDESGEPKGLTFIAKPNNEAEIYRFAKYFENSTKHRKSPELKTDKTTEL